MPVNPTTQVIRAGDTTKPNPITVIIVGNPSLEAPRNSGTFIIDPITFDQPAFDNCVRYIEDSLFGTLAGQSEKLLSDPSIGPKVRLVSLFVTGLPPQSANSLVAQDAVSNLLVARRSVFRSFLTGFALEADIVYAVSKSETHARASAWYTTDDEGSGGISFTLDGVSLSHRFLNLIPGAIALHANSSSLTALHEFGHAVSSYQNGSVVDLYVDSPPGLNNKQGRPIPSHFATYNGTAFQSDLLRDSLTYPSGWQSYHCELNDPTLPAVMDDFRMASVGNRLKCQHDKITRRFLVDRLRAKISR